MRTARSRDEEDPVVSQRENVVAVTEEDNGGQPPMAGDTDTDAATVPAGKASDDGGAPQPGEPAEPTGETEPAGRSEPGEPAGPAVAAGEAGAAADGDGTDVEAGAAADGDGSDGEAATPGREIVDLEQESEIAADYVEGLLDVADLDGDIDMD